MCARAGTVAKLEAPAPDLGAPLPRSALCSVALQMTYKSFPLRDAELAENVGELETAVHAVSAFTKNRCAGPGTLGSAHGRCGRVGGMGRTCRPS